MTPPTIQQRAGIVRYFSQKPVRNRKDLRRLSAAIVGGPWIDKPLCPGHASPWQMIEDAFFGAAPEILGIGPRAGYKTQSIGLLNALELIAKPGIRIAHAAESLTQAERAHRWTIHYAFSSAAKLSGILEGAKASRWGLELPNGSGIEVITSSASGLNALHVNSLRLDEFELLATRRDVVDEAFLVPQSFGGYKRGLLFVSSRKFRNGPVDKILYDRRHRSVKKLIWCVADVVERCPESRRGEETAYYEDVPDPSDPNAPSGPIKAWKGCGTCVLLEDCRGQFARASGWAKIDDVAREFVSVDRSTWIAQKRSRRIEMSAGRVFPLFSRRTHVEEIDPIPGVPLRVSVDFGGGRAATALLVWQQDDRGIVRILAEYVRAGSGPDEDAPAAEAMIDRIFPDLPVDPSPADSAQPLMIDRWNVLAKRIRLRAVAKMAVKRDMISALSALIQPSGGKPRYVVHPRCEDHIEELIAFRYRERIASQFHSPRTADYADTKSDTIDAASYIAVEIGGAAYAPRVWILSTRGGVADVVSEDGKGKPSPNTYEDYVAAKLNRLLQRHRD